MTTFAAQRRVDTTHEPRAIDPAADSRRTDATPETLGIDAAAGTRRTDAGARGIHTTAETLVPGASCARLAPDDLHPLRLRGPKYPPHDANAPILESIDMAGLAAAIVITLGPLAAYAVGFGA